MWVCLRSATTPSSGDGLPGWRHPARRYLRLPARCITAPPVPPAPPGAILPGPPMANGAILRWTIGTPQRPRGRVTPQGPETTLALAGLARAASAAENGKRPSSKKGTDREIRSFFAFSFPSAVPGTQPQPGPAFALPLPAPCRRGRETVPVPAHHPDREWGLLRKRCTDQCPRRRG